MFIHNQVQHRCYLLILLVQVQFIIQVILISVYVDNLRQEKDHLFLLHIQTTPHLSTVSLDCKYVI